MNTMYWDLFWTTGMPEAWLMSRGRSGSAEAAARPGAESLEGLSTPLVNFQPHLSANVPGGPERLY